MHITTITSREFNLDVSKAKKATVGGPTFITNRGNPAHVLLTIEEYQQITDKRESIVDLLSMPDTNTFEFEPPRISGSLHKPVDFS
jgi:PHD/YefM family antitoxin component YafN of YafNO toxin-antitoxin module